MAVGLVFDKISALLQHYLQGIKRRYLLNALCLGERFLVPVTTAFVLGGRIGSDRTPRADPRVNADPPGVFDTHVHSEIIGKRSHS